MAEFPQLFNKFHKAKWQENVINLQSIPTCFDWANSSNSSNFLLVGDSEGSLHSVNINSSAALSIISSKKICEKRLRHVRSNLLGNLSVSTAQTSNFVILTHHNPSTGQILSEKSSTKIKTDGIAFAAAFMDDLTTQQNLLLIGERQGIRVVDVETGMTFRKFEHAGGATAIRCRKGCMFQSKTLDGNVTVWDVRQNKPIELYGPKKRINKSCIYAMDASERYLAIAEVGGFIQLNDLQSRKKLTDQKLQENEIRSLSFSNGWRFLTSTDEFSIYVHNLSEKVTTTGGFRLPFEEISKVQNIIETSWHPNECLFVARGSDKNLRSYIPTFD